MIDIEYFGFKESDSTDKWITDYSFINNVSNIFYELKIYDDGEYNLWERQEWIRNNGCGGSTSLVYKGKINDNNHFLSILVEKEVKLLDIQRHLKIEKLLSNVEI